MVYKFEMGYNIITEYSFVERTVKVLLITLEKADGQEISLGSQEPSRLGKVK